MEKEIREIFTKVEFDCDSWNTNVIETKEYNKRKDDSVARLTALFKAKMLEIIGEDYPIVKSLTDEGKIWMKGYNRRGEELRKKVEGV